MTGPKLLAFMLLAMAINLPFGSYRNKTRKFSLAWFLSIHIPIPFIIVMRSLVFGLGAYAIPFSLAAAVGGQLLGSRFTWFGATAKDVPVAAESPLIDQPTPARVPVRQD